MIIRIPAGVFLAAGVMAISGFHFGPSPESELAGIVKAYLAMSLPSDWESLDRLPAIRWAALPPTALRNCLPDGGCFTRQGTAAVGGRNLTVIATGARTMVLNIFLRNRGPARRTRDRGRTETSRPGG
jgi:hypothetical protein